MDAPAEIGQRAGWRDFLAAERTFLAWIRTGLALMGFGFVVARFGLFLQQLQLIQNTPLAPSYGLSLSANRSGSGRVCLFRMASSSTGPGVASGRAFAFPSIETGCVDRSVPGFGWNRDGDLPGFHS